MSIWDAFPADYRAAEVQLICEAAQAGECVSVVGLSGAGKSNLLGYLAHRQPAGARLCFVLVDANRLPEPSTTSFLRLMRQALELAVPGANVAQVDADDALACLDASIGVRLASRLCLLLDLSLLVDREGRVFGGQGSGLWNNLRALRDRYKYELTYVVATRHRLPTASELAELFFGHTLCLGPLSESDARWNVVRYAERMHRQWDSEEVEAMLRLSGRYAALLRAVCEAHAASVPLEAGPLARHESVRARLEEFWADRPEPAELAEAGFGGIGLLSAARRMPFDTTQLTAKEDRLLKALQTQPGAVREKDDLIRAVWPEDKVFEAGVRDDSLAQLVRRLREKIEPDASNPRFILTVPGRGYRFVGQPQVETHSKDME